MHIVAPKYFAAFYGTQVLCTYKCVASVFIYSRTTSQHHDFPQLQEKQRDKCANDTYSDHTMGIHRIHFSILLRNINRIMTKLYIHCHVVRLRNKRRLL